MNGYDWRRMAAAADYDRRARMHAPLDPETLAAAIRKLRHDGLRPRDISVALRLDLGAVVQALRDVPDSATERVRQTSGSSLDAAGTVPWRIFWRA